MSFIRRLIQGGPPAEGAAPPVVPAPRAVMDERGVIYVGMACPYCGVEFDKPPGSSRKCPACGQHVIRDRSALDDLVRLIREDQVSDATYDAVQLARDRQFQAKDPGPMRKLNAGALRTYASLGVHVAIVNRGSASIVATVTSSGSLHVKGTAECKPCRDLNGATYPANRAPLLPLAECTSRPNRICSCRYKAFIPTA